MMMILFVAAVLVSAALFHTSPSEEMRRTEALKLVGSFRGC